MMKFSSSLLSMQPMAAWSRGGGERTGASVRKEEWPAAAAAAAPAAAAAAGSSSLVGESSKPGTDAHRVGLVTTLEGPLGVTWPVQVKEDDAAVEGGSEYPPCMIQVVCMCSAAQQKSGLRALAAAAPGRHPPRSFVRMPLTISEWQSITGSTSLTTSTLSTMPPAFELPDMSLRGRRGGQRRQQPSADALG